MRFWCYNHYGEVEKAKASGYGLGHRTNRYEANERDLEGIFFTFETTDNGVEIVNVRGASHARDYLSKFGDWESMILNAFVENADAEGRTCPKCDDWGVLILEDDEEPPERYQPDEDDDTDDDDKGGEGQNTDRRASYSSTNGSYADDEPRYIQ